MIIIRKNNKQYEIEYVENEFMKKNYTLLSKEYKNMNNKLDYICNKHKEIGIQKVSFYSFSKNRCNCSLCKSENNSKNWHENRKFIPMSQEKFYNKHYNEYKEKLYNAVNTEYELLNVYSKDKRSYMTLKHNVCNYIYDVDVYKFFSRGQRCPNKECNSKVRSIAYMKPISQLKQEISDLVGDEYKLIGDYTGTNNDAIFYHEVCNHTFHKTPHNFLSGQRCPHCIAPTKGEKKIIEYLELHNIKYTFQKKYIDLRGINNGLLSYDIYIDDYNILVEYQGQFHDGSAFKNSNMTINRQKEHDKRKKQYAKEHDIKLIEIWYWDYDKIEEILSKELNLVA